MVNSNLPRARGRPPTEKQIVIDAAIRCLEKNGSARTSLAEIAEEAGVSRQTVYRLFEDRTKLIEQVLFMCFARLGDRVITKIDEIEDPWEAIVEGVLASVQAAQEDHVINEIIRKDSDFRIESLIVRSNDPMSRRMLAYWGPIFDRAKDGGIVSSSLTNARIFELLMSFFAILMLRADSEKVEQRRFLVQLFKGVLSTT